MQSLRVEILQKEQDIEKEKSASYDKDKVIAALREEVAAAVSESSI